MSRLPGISDLFRSRSQARRRKPKRRRETERFAGRMESLESRALLAFSTLPASGDLLGGAIKLTSDIANQNHELTIILDDQSNPTSVTATITTFDGTTTKTGQFFNFSGISYLASNDTDGSVVNSVKLWTSYEADLASYENAPSNTSQVGLATLWQVKSHFPTLAKTSLLTMENVDRLVVTSGVIGGGASTIAGEFESPTLAASLTAKTAAQVTLNSGTRVTGANIGGTADLEPIVAYTLTLQSQTAGVTLGADVFTVGDLTINAAGTITLNGLLQSTSGDIEVESTSGQILLDGAELHALDGGITLRTLKEGIVQVPATAPNPRWQDYIVADTDLTIEAGGEVVLIGGVRANTGDIELSSKDRGIQFTGDDAVLHAVAGSVEINATRGPATLQNLFANKSITVNALGDVSLNGTIQTTSGDFVVNSDGNIGNSARLLVGGSLTLDSGLNVGSLGGGIVRLELLSGGTNYEYAIVTIAPPAAGGGRAALARAVIDDEGVITELTIVDPGYGYSPNEQAAVSIEGNPAVPGGPGLPGTPAASGAKATAFAGATLSSMQAGKNLTITAGTSVDITNELRAENGDVTVTVSAGPLSLSDIFSGTGVSLEAAQTIDLGGLVRATKGDVLVNSLGGGVDVGATLLALAGGATVTAAGQIVQRGGSVSRDRLFLLTGGREYTYAQVVVDPPPGAGQRALARAVITPYNPLDPTEGGFISDIILLDPGWGYPSDSRVIVQIQGDGEGARAVFATDIVTSSIDVRDDVTVQAGDAITLVSSVRSSDGKVTLRNTTGDLAVQSVTSALAAEVESERGKVTLVSVAAGGKVDIAAFRGVSVTDSVNTTAGDIAITTIDGDLTFLPGFDLGNNDLVDADATALQPRAVIATAAGGIELRSNNGSITTPFVVNATDDVKITSFGMLDATNEIASTLGDVELRSTSGQIQLGANVAAVGGSVTIEAHTQLKQNASSGVSKIELLAQGDVVEDTAPQVTVTVAAPRNGGTAATAEARIVRRSNGGDGFGIDDDDDEYFLGGIVIIDAGQGYAVGEQPSVTITGINGASARAFGPLNAAMLSAGEGITLSAGEDLTLVTKVHATTGSVIVQSAAGNIDLSDRSLLLSAADGSVSVDALRGTVVVQRAVAADDVTVNGLGGITVLGSVVSEDAGITLKALDGAVEARQVNAAGDVTITSFKSGKLAGEIASSAGAVAFTSLAGGLFLEANIVADGAVDIEAQTFILQDGRSGVERIDVIDGGSATGETPPAVTVTVAAPVAGGTAARAQAVIGQRSATEYFIESIFIIDPGTGYALGEVAEVTITGMSGAQARAFGPTNLRNVTGGTGVTLEAGDDITLVNTVTATTGDVVVTSKTGNLQLNANGFLARAAEGSVSLNGSAGSVFVQRASASEDVTLFAAKDVVVLGSVDAGNDASVVTGADGFVSVTRIVAGDSVTVTAGHDVELLELVDAATGGVVVTSTAGGLVTNDIYAELDITLTIAEQVTLLGVLESDAGDIEVTSLKRDLDLTAAGARIAVDAGSATLTAINGTVLTPPVLQANGDVTIRGLTTIGLRNEVTSATGTITVESVSGGIELTGNLNAVAGAIDLVAHGAVTQSGRGVSYVEVLTGGTGYDASATVTIAAPAAAGGRAATGRLVLGTVGGAPGVIIGITVVDPGVGYAAGELPTVTIAGAGTGGTARAVVISGPQTIVAGTDVTVDAGTDVVLLNAVTATAGDVSVRSKSGSVTFSGNAVTAGDTISVEARGVAGTAPSLVGERFEFRGLGPAAVNFNGANNVRELFVSSKGSFAFQNNGDLALTDGLSTASVQATTAGDLTVNVANGSLRVVDGISYGGTLRLSANNSPRGVQFVTTADTDSLLSGFTGSLRNMIGYVNANAARSPMSLVFDEAGSPIEASGVIAVAAALPGIEKAVRFDGSLADGTIVGLDGSKVAAANATGLTLANGSGGSVVQDAAVYGFKGAGVQLSSGTNIVRGMNVGLDRSGNSAAANGVGIDVVGTNARSNVIGAAGIGDVGNVIGNSAVAGIRIRGGATATAIYGNQIGGEDASPSPVAVGSKLDGIAVLNSLGTVIGGVSPGQANSISGNGRFGVFLSNVNAASPAQGTRIVANSIADNVDAGVAIVGGSGNTVGGAQVGTGNTITGNRDGIVLRSSSAAVTFNNIVVGNTIEDSGRDGVRLEAGYGSQINANTIEGSVESGVRIAGAVASRTQGTHRVFGNVISKSGSNAANGGVVLEGAFGQMVGQAADGAWVGNTIQESTGSGIVVLGGTTGSQVQANVIRANRVSQSNFGGIRVQRSSANIIQGNAVSDNRSDGIAFVDAIAPAVDKGNVAIGNTVSGNDGAGIRVQGGSRAVIGGAAAAQGNAVFANEGDGIVVEASTGTGAALGVAVRGNVVGIDRTGASAGNQGFGVTVSGADSTAVAFGNVVRNNVSGGIQVVGGRATTIGSPIAGRGNVISGNLGAGGVLVGRVGVRTQGVTIAGNAIESNAPGYGIQVVAPTTSGVVVGRSPSITQPDGSGNTIRDNESAGVRVDGAQAVTILGNSFADNGGLPIELANGGNGSIPAPTLTMARAVASNQRTPRYEVRGTVAGTAGQRFFVDLYGNRPADGRQFYLGRVLVTIAASGVGTFRTFVNGAVGGASEVVATATLANTLVAGTSQFSAEIPTT